MSKSAVVYWSGTGNTEAMAKAIASAAGSELYTANDFDASMADNYDAIAFGCPAMGAESLEETEFEPMFDACKVKLGGKKIALFGSYGWGEGDWMDIWKDDCIAAGAEVVGTVICQGTPDGTALNELKTLAGKIK